MNRAREGFKVLYKHFGTAPEFSYIKLENIYRSELAEFVARIFPD
jgi:predicted ribonuclease YlaK